MKEWIVELVTDETYCQPIEINASMIIKKSYKSIFIDGIEWKLPEIKGMTWAAVGCRSHHVDEDEIYKDQ